MIARHADSLTAAANDINSAYSLTPASGAAPFPISAYTRSEIERVFEEIKAFWKGAEIRVAVYNSGHRIARPFLELTQEDIGMF